uniref:BlaI/MecI/CopY family transcriptional regulator n=1 Tax=uncultured Draconibacterium sp. TaxID=1573823 RepID=UPI0032166442
MDLTKAEEQIMQHLWDMKEGIVRDIRDKFEDPKPARNTVSTVLRVLEKKEFVSHKSYGNVHVYFPLVSREEYSRTQLTGLMKKYFDNSFSSLATFFAKEKDLSIQDLEELMNETKKKLSNS